MKINDKNLIIPPFISTSWNKVESLFFKQGNLVISLKNGDSVEVPDLSPETIENIFEVHEKFLESTPSETEKEQKDDKAPLVEFMQNLFSNLPISDIQFTAMPMGGMEGMNSVMQHDMSQSDSPDLPAEFIERITSVIKMMNPDGLENLPDAEPHCNCPHCQISRSLQGTPKETEEESEEEVEDEELEFKEWDIFPEGDQLYRVVSRLDPKEEYKVFLGEPTGCTCGKDGCEHLLEVLRS